jgi:hypothetical protein
MLLRQEADELRPEPGAVLLREADAAIGNDDREPATVLLHLHVDGPASLGREGVFQAVGDKLIYNEADVYGELPRHLQSRTMHANRNRSHVAEHVAQTLTETANIP